MASDNDKAIENFNRYVYARDNGHRKYLNKAEKCENFYYGEQWDPEVEAKLRATNKPVLTINKTFATISTIQGEQISSAADVTYKPKASGTPETAEMLSKLWTQVSSSNNLTRLEEEVFLSGAITSRGYFDMRTDYDDQLRGEVKITRQKAKNVVLDPDGDSYDPKDWSEVFITTWMTPHMIEKNYDKEKAKELEKREGSKFHIGYDSIDHISNVFGQQQHLGPLSGEHNKIKNTRRYIRVLERQFKDFRIKPHFVDRATGDMRVIPDSWEDERIKLAIDLYGLAVFEKKAEVYKWIVTADDLVLFEEDMPDPGFTIIPYFPFFYEGKTIGLIENLLSPQELLNKVSSQELHIVNTTANSGWKLKTGSLQNMDPEELELRGAETGLVMELNDPSDAEKITPNTVPTGLDRIGFKADENMKEISGVSDSKRGFDRADVAAKAIKAKQQAGSINLAVPLSNLIRTRHLLAERALQLMQAHYTETRVVQITQNGLNQQPEQLTINQPNPEGGVINDLTIGEYATVVTDVPKRDTFEDLQFSEAVQLRELGVAIPDHVLISSSHLQNKEEIAQEVKELQGGGEATEAQQQLEALELQGKELELQETQASILQKKADAAGKLARAQAEAQGDNSGETAAEQAAGELVLKQQEIQANIKLEREKLTAEIALKREEAQAEIELKREIARAELVIKRAEAAEKVALAKEIEKNKPKPAPAAAAKPAATEKK